MVQSLADSGPHRAAGWYRRRVDILLPCDDKAQRLLAFDPGGTRLAVALDARIFLYDLCNGGLLREICVVSPEDASDTRCSLEVLRFTPDGCSLRVVTETSQWQGLETWIGAWSFDCDGSSSRNAMLFGPARPRAWTVASDGASILAEQRGLFLEHVDLVGWRWRSTIKPPPGAGGEQACLDLLSLSPDGQRIAAVSSVGEVTLWSAATERWGAPYHLDLFRPGACWSRVGWAETPHLFLAGTLLLHAGDRWRSCSALLRRLEFDARGSLVAGVELPAARFGETEEVWPFRVDPRRGLAWWYTWQTIGGETRYALHRQHLASGRCERVAEASALPFALSEDRSRVAFFDEGCVGIRSVQPSREGTDGPE